ncbi:MAG: hypothetical protein M3388_05065 [Acidobacteriota bacterium]|nr:hypothetical protein [Acidobacteriota bacterium]
MGKRLTEFCLLAIVLSLVSIIGEAQTIAKDELPRGVVIEKVACLNDNAQSYALYLPTNYTPDKRWAILYAFDPFAQGKVPVEIFRDAAERFGFIVVGSNNSQNNSGLQKLTEIITAFWKDSHARFSIDEKRTYATGLSGGARVANYFAASCRGCVAGVIACGATFSPKFPLDRSLPFPIFGTVGTDDFNYPELIKTFEKLKEIGITNRLDVFDGRHGWLTKDLTFDALEWMNLQAMNSGRMERDKKFIENLLTKQTNKAQALVHNGDLLEAARIYDNIISDFKDISETKTADEKLAEIKRQKSYKKLAEEEKDSFDEQHKTAKIIIGMGATLRDSSSDKNSARQQATNEVESWRQKVKASHNSSERRLARRILGQVFVETYEAALYINERQKDYKTMIANLELTRLINPQNSKTLLELARAYALGDREKDALDVLEEAVKNGFFDCAQIIDKVEWINLRQDKQFQKIAGQMNCEKKGT